MDTAREKVVLKTAARRVLTSGVYIETSANGSPVKIPAGVFIRQAGVRFGLSGEEAENYFINMVEKVVEQVECILEEEVNKV